MWCRISEWFLSRPVDTGRHSLPQLVARHVAGCPHCRTYQASVQVLDEQLRVSARHEFERCLPRDLHRQLVAELRALPRPAPRPGPAAANRWWLAAAAALVLAVALGLFLAHQRPARPAPGNEFVQPVPPKTWPRIATAAPVGSMAALDRQVKLATEAQYQQELSRLRRDVGRATGFVLGAIE